MLRAANLKWKHSSVEEIAEKIADVRRAVDGGVSIVAALRQANVSKSTYYRWLASYGETGAAVPNGNMAKMRKLERENARLRRVLREFEGESRQRRK